MYHKRCENFDICIGLYKHALMISLQRHCGDEVTVTEHLRDLTDVSYAMITNSVPPRQEVFVEILQLAYLKYEKEVKLRRQLDDKSLYSGYLYDLLNNSLELTNHCQSCTL